MIRPFAFAALTGLLLVACTSGDRNVGTQVSFALQTLPANTAGMSAGNKTFTNLEGTDITLTRAHLTLSSVSVTDDCGEATFASLNPLNWIIPAAHAHTGSSPTRLGEPHIFNLLGEDGVTRELGSVSPPIGDYCGTTWQIAAADDDAIGLTETPDMEGFSLRLAGSYGSTADTFAIDLSLSLLPIDRLSETTLSLSAEQASAELVLSFAYDRWFDGVDMDALASGDANARDLLLNNLRDTANLSTSPQN